MSFARAILLAVAMLGISSVQAQQDFMSLAEDANFRESDRNGDGILDADEWRVYIGEQVGEQRS